MSLSCYCDDGPEFFHASERKARKPHRCCECTETIQPGQMYEHVVGKWEGMMDAFDTCESCSDLRESFKALGYCMNFGDLWETHKEWIEMKKEINSRRLTIRRATF